MKISYGITVHNEADELNKLLEILIHQTQPDDEIVICDDYSDEKTQEVITSWVQQYGSDDVDKKKDIIVYKRKLNGNFSDQKNSVIEKCSGDFIFHIDADEYPHENLIHILPEMLRINEVDLVWIPRVNTIENMKEEHIQKWGWRVSDSGWVNYPDYQARVFRNDEKIRWTRPLHEYITGCKTYSHLPPHEELSLYHPKTIEKQEQQNLFYNQNFSRELNVRK
jgi:glycosyltransferase involved in cell wall biosynthesis|tara:strand:- start:20200 stop:20868 length:669 start_codon:yes stop_codon:yes gene_type:complete